MRSIKTQASCTWLYVAVNEVERVQVTNGIYNLRQGQQCVRNDLCTTTTPIAQLKT
jgi:hypothetical protein